MNPDSELSLTEEEFQTNDTQNLWNVIFQRLKNEATVVAKDCSTQIARFPLNRNRNRYRDVSPYDHSRICLTSLSDNDYINASLVRVPEANNRHYILTQGPLSSTSGHFWLMVWQEFCPVIVMLNKLVEKHVPKCHPYFPHGRSHGDEDEKVFDEVGLKVSFVSENHYGFYIQRTFILENLQTGESRSVLHFHYLAWPDFGVPQSPGVFLNFLWSVRQAAGSDSFQVDYNNSTDHLLSSEGEEIDFNNSPPLLNPAPIKIRPGPPLIHCSAGIGRSGTFALVDSALTIVQKHRSLHQVNLIHLILQMRQDRMGLIQSCEQLRFSYQAVIEGAHTILNLPSEEHDSIVFPMDSQTEYKESDSSSESSSGESDVEQIIFDSDESDSEEASSADDDSDCPMSRKRSVNNLNTGGDDDPLSSNDIYPPPETFVHQRLLSEETPITPEHVNPVIMSNTNAIESPTNSTTHGDEQSETITLTRKERKEQMEAKIREIKAGMERGYVSSNLTRIALTGGCIAVVVAGLAVVVYKYYL